MESPRNQKRETAHAAWQALEARRSALPDGQMLDNNGVLWDIGDIDLVNLIQEEALEDDTSFERARRKVLRNIGYWVPGARRIAPSPEPSSAYPQALDEGDVNARRSIDGER